LRPEDKPVFEELLTTPYSQEIGTGYSSGPGDIYFFAGNRDIKQVYAIKDDFWKRTGQFTIAERPEVDVPKGGLVDVALSFERPAATGLQR
jgi:hypothetical protein